jgi:hypothetical protein
VADNGVALEEEEEDPEELHHDGLRIHAIQLGQSKHTHIDKLRVGNLTIPV